jgi:catechol 2,3-dioxygenase-like lactoylglutathione lyase family enzyme
VACQNAGMSAVMAKVAAKKAKKKTSVASKAKKSAPKKAKTTVQAAKKAFAPPPAAEAGGDKLSFNHAMVYVKHVQRALGFYRDLLGFKVVDEFRYEGEPVYARLRAPGGDGTIALHMAGPGTSLASDGVRLYFEIRELDDFCRKLQAKGFYITQMPRTMPWGWRHAYLNDPDGHEISLYWAGENRMKKTVMRTAKEVEKTPAAKGR